MIKKVSFKIEQKEQNYDYLVGKGFFKELISYLKEKKEQDQKIVLISDENVKRLHLDKIKEIQNYSAAVIIVPAGEKSKSREVKAKVENVLIKKKFGRKTILAALGGGVVGDLAGYIASTYNRGIPYIQIPTTLLAMVDSSIGGKTGINTALGKNLLGTIYQPLAVFAETDFLKTLPKEEYLNGLAEIIKIACVSDKRLFTTIEKNVEKTLERDEEFLSAIIKRSVELKKNVVEKDPAEEGLRQILNYGHTIGHAIEIFTEHQIKHGSAVSIGMNMESKLAEKLGHLSKKDSARINSLLKSAGLLTDVSEIPVISSGEISEEIKQLIEIMKNDKKNKEGKINVVLLKTIGKVLVKKEVKKKIKKESKKNTEKKYSFPIDYFWIEKEILRECLAKECLAEESLIKDDQDNKIKD